MESIGARCRGDAVNGWVLDPIPAMVMYRSKMCGSEWSDREIEELIGQLMLPLLRPVTSCCVCRGPSRGPAGHSAITGAVPGAGVSRGDPGGVG